MTIVNDKMSDTPETDEIAEGVDQSNFEDSWRDDFEEFAWVPAEFARKLERERDEARERIERQKLEINRLNGATNHAGGTPLKIALRKRDEWAAMCGRYKQERDDARQALKHIEEYGTEEINAAVDLRQKLASALVERDEVQKSVNGLCKHLGVSPANTTLLAVEVLRIQREREEAITRRMETIMQCELYEQERDEARKKCASWVREWRELRVLWRLLDEDANDRLQERDEAREENEKLREALLRIRTWGIESKNFSSNDNGKMAHWIDEGCIGELPKPDGHWIYEKMEEAK